MLLKDWCKIVERKKGEEWCIGRGGVRFHRMLYIVAKYTGSKVYAGVFSMQSLSTRVVKAGFLKAVREAVA